MKKEEFEHKQKKETFKFTLVKDYSRIRSPLDLFDSLPSYIQQNHKLLTAFCQWYLLSKTHNLAKGKTDESLGRSVSYYFKDAMHAIALKLHNEDPSSKAPAILKHPDMRAFIKEARANKEAVCEPGTWLRWIQRIIKMKKERGWN